MDEHAERLAGDNPAGRPTIAELEAVQQAAQRYRLVADSTWDWEFWMTPDQAMAYISPSCERISGYPPAFFQSCANLLEIVHPADRPAVQAEMAALAAGPADRNDCTLRLIRRDGTECWVSMAYGPVRGPDGAFLGARGSIRDIGARKALEAENRRQQAFLERIFDSMSEAVLVFDTSGRLVRASRAAIAAYGFDPTNETMGEVVARLALRRPDGRPLRGEELPGARALRGEVLARERMVLTNARGQEMSVLASAAPLTTDGRITGSVVIWLDITESAAAAARLEQLVAELDAVIGAIPGGLVLYDAAGRIVRLNRVAQELLGYGPSDIELGLTRRAAARAVVDGSGRPVPVDRLPVARALRGETVEFFVMGFESPAADGPPTWLSVSAAPILDPAGRQIGAVASLADITALRQAEARLEAAYDNVAMQAEELETQAEELRAQNEELERLAADLADERATLSAIVDNAPEAIVVADAGARLVRTNPAADRLYARPIPVGKDYRSHVALRLCYPDGTACDPRDLPLTRSALDGETHANVELAIVWPDGLLRDLLVNSAPIRDATGRVTGAVGVFQDISERKAAERDRERLLAEVEAAYQRVVEQAETLEMQAEELAAQNEELLSVTQRLSAEQAHLQEANRRLSQQTEETLAQAEELHVRNLELEMMSRQVQTERGRLEAVLDQMPGGVVIAEAPSGRVVLVNRRTEELLRGPYPPPGGPEDYAAYASYYPDGRPYLAEEMPLARAVLCGESVDNEEIHYVRGDGSRAVQVVSARPVRDGEGRLTAGVIVFMDITERKQMEDELARARGELEQRVRERTADLARANQALQYQAHLLANIHDAIVATDAEGGITAWNRAAERLYGWTLNEVVGRPLDEVVQPHALREAGDDALRTVPQHGLPSAAEVHHRRDGSEIIVEATGMELAGAARQLGGYVSVNRDVTRRARAEAALRESEERYRVVSELTSDFVYRLRVDPDGRMEGTFVTEGFGRLTGYTQDQAKELANWSRAVHPDDMASTAEFLGRVVATGRPGSTEVRLVTAAGRVLWTNVFARPCLDETQGRVVAIEGAVQDITERVQARQMLEQRVKERTRELSTLLAVSNSMTSKLELGALLSAMADLLRDVVDYTGLIIYEIDGDDLEVVEYRGPVDRAEALHLRLRTSASVGLDRVVHEREPVIMPDVQGDTPLARAWQRSAHSVQARLIGGARSWLAVPIVAKETVVGVLRLGHDEPDHFSPHHAALALAFAGHAAVAMENARLYRQAGALAALEERQRLARDLHDAVSQTLFSASLTADVLPALYDRDPAHGRELLSELRELNRGAMAEMRMLLLELRPQALLEMDLATLLRHLGEGAAARGRLKVDIAARNPGRLPADVQVALYRIAQEAMNNVIKHAQAASVKVDLSVLPPGGPRSDQPGVKLCIVDDGRGFDPANVEPHRFGLGIMAERAAAIGAALSIASTPGEGTTVKVVWKNN